VLPVSLTPKVSLFQGGWIDIVGVTSRIYPRTVDNRNGRAAGLNPADPSNGFSRTEASTGACYQGAKGSARVDCGPTTHNGAPTGRPRECAAGEIPTCQMDGTNYLWSHTDFSVRFGNGGAISMMQSGSATISDSRFESNMAGTGTQVFAVAVPSLTLTNTTFSASDEIKAVGKMMDLDGVALEDCSTLP